MYTREQLNGITFYNTCHDIYTIYAYDTIQDPYVVSQSNSYRYDGFSVSYINQLVESGQWTIIQKIYELW